MDPSLIILISISLIIFLVAGLYASVGHGGASGYLAVLSLLAIPPDNMATTALILNILVAGIAFITYFRSGYFSFSLISPFLLTSIPAAFLGGLIHLGEKPYLLLLGSVLVFAAWRLIKPPSSSEEVTVYNPPPLLTAMTSGGGIGLLSGMIGIGGGIFLSPLMVLFKWAKPKQTAAVSAFFIVVNSISGILGRALAGKLVVGTLSPFLIAAILGGLVGAHLGANKLSNPRLRQLLGFILLVATAKIIFQLLAH